MRRVLLISIASVCLAGLALAQGTTWAEFVSKQDFFSISFPGQPTVQAITYPTEYRIALPGRVYAFGSGGARYSVQLQRPRLLEPAHEGKARADEQRAGGDHDRKGIVDRIWRPGRGTSDLPGRTYAA